MTKSTDISDDALLERIMNGDSGAYRFVVDRYKDKIANVVKGMLGDTAEAEDVGQEVFIRFYRNMDKFRGDARLGTYLTRIAINLSLNELKQRKKRYLHVVRPGDQIPDKVDDSSAPERQENKELLQKVLMQLDEEFRTIVVLRLIEGYSTKEVSEMLGIPLGTVLSRLSRAQKKMKEILSTLNIEL